MNSLSKRVLITGGAGFIGSHIADRLISMGYIVRIFDNLDPQVHGDHEVTKDGWPTYLNEACELVRGDICDYEAVVKSLADVQYLIHLAANVGVGQSMTQIIRYTKTNALGTATLLQAMVDKKYPIERMAVASSMSIYGEGMYKAITGETVAPLLRSYNQLQQHEWELTKNGNELTPVATNETKPLQPASIYAIGKRDHEEMCLVVGKALGIPTVALRLFNTYGTRQALSNPYTGVAAIFVSRLANNQPPLIFEDGKQLRDFIHVSDIARAFTTVLFSDKKVWNAYNVGTGKAVTIEHVALTLMRLMNKNHLTPTILNKYRIGDVRHCYADTQALERDFGFRATTPFEEGMKELVAWINPHHTIVDRIETSLQQLASNNLLL